MAALMQRREFLGQVTLAGAVALAMGASGSWAAEILARVPASGSGVSLDSEQRSLVAAMAEAILPATDTPGAVGAGVPQFLELLCIEWMLPAEQADFVTALAEFDRRSVSATQRAFVHCDASQQLELLRQWDAEAERARQARQPPPYFAKFRSLVLIGYYTSEIGQEQELKMQYGGGADRPGGPVFGGAPIKV